MNLRNVYLFNVENAPNNFDFSVAVWLRALIISHSHAQNYRVAIAVTNTLFGLRRTMFRSW